MTLRESLKKTFDGIVYRHAFANRLLRNINKLFASVTAFRLRPYGVLRVGLRSGVQFRMETNETSSVTKLLFWNGADGYEYTPVFEKLVARCNTFVDIGANTGYYALLAAAANKDVRVFAAEPASAPYHFLRRNILLNNLQHRVKGFPIAISDQPGVIEFFELVNSDHYHTKYNLAGTGTLRKEDLKDQFSTNSVICDTLDRFVAQHGIERVDLIKMDTEGTENRILAGAHQTLLVHKPIIICETLFNTIEAELEKIMLSYGYLFFNHRNGRLTKTQTLVRKQDDGIRDCFFVHPDKLNDVREFISPLTG